MTRINYGIAPSELCKKHLQAEKYEISRIPNLIKKGKYRLEHIPEHFTLGTGHVKFFYAKLKYLHRRYDELHAECLRRGYESNYQAEIWQDLPEALYNDSTPRNIDREITRQRINERLSGMCKTSEEYEALEIQFSENYEANPNRL